MTLDRFAYLEAEQLGPEELTILRTVPKRWGRMDRLSRLAIVEVGRALIDAGLRRPGVVSQESLSRTGLVAATRRGSLATDLAYAKTMDQGLGLASPLLFSYTLANIALAEAASHFGIKGPVYALYSEKSPLTAARREAERWLKTDRDIAVMVAGEIDCYWGDGALLSVADFVVLRNDEK